MSKSTAISIDAGQTVENAFEHVLRSNLTGAQAWEPVALAGDDIEAGGFPTGSKSESGEQNSLMNSGKD